MMRGKEAENIYLGAAKLVALMMKALEKFLAVSISSIN